MDYLKEKQLDCARFLIENEIPFVNEDWCFNGESIYVGVYSWHFDECELVIDADILSLADEDGYEVAIFKDGSIEIKEPEDEIEFEHDEELKPRTTELDILKLENAELLRENSELLYRVELLEEMHNNLVNLFNKRRVS